MNAFNRIALLVIVAVLLVYCAMGIVVAAGGLAAQSIAGNPSLYAPLAVFAGVSGGSAVFAFLLCAVIILVALAIIAGELLSIGPQRSLLTIVQDPAGRVILDRQVVRELAELEARTVFGVIRCRMRVGAENGGLVLTGRLVVDRYANLIDVSRAVRDHVKDSVEHSLGQTVSEVRLRCAAGSRRQWPTVSMRWLRDLSSWRPRPVAHSEHGDVLMQMKMNPLQLVERAGPLATGLAAALAIILGLLVIAFPILLAWAVGIALMLGGVAILVALYTLHAEQEAKSSPEQSFAQEQR